MKNTDPDYIPFGDIARQQIGMQCQYAKDYLDADDYPDLATGVRWKGRLADYHSVVIHKDDVAGFVERVIAFRRARGVIP
jgi:hypothetical protein